MGIPLPGPNVCRDTLLAAFPLSLAGSSIVSHTLTPHLVFPQLFARAGYEVTLYDIDAKQLEGALTVRGRQCSPTAWVKLDGNISLQ